MSSEELFNCQLIPVLEDAFTSSGLQELVSLFHSGFPTQSTSGSETNQNGIPSNSTSGSETTRSVYSAEERKRRRMDSNRESAKRSRLRKKEQLEGLTSQMNQLRLENRELRNQLGLITHHYHAVQSDSTRLLAECIDLQQKLDVLNHFWVNMQLQ